MNKLFYICRAVDNQPQELNYKNKDELLDQAASIITNPHLELLDLIVEDQKIRWAVYSDKIVFIDSVGEIIKKVKLKKF